MQKNLYLLLLILVVFYPGTIHAQQSNEQPIRIVFQLTTGDTLAHKGLIKQLRNIQKADATAQVEVVCHGPGIDMLINERSTVKNQINAFIKSGVVFDVCQNTMNDQNINESQLIEGVIIVPAGIIHVVKLQAAGWSYIKAGF